MKQPLLRLVCLFACVLFFCGLTACANKEDSPDSQQAATEPTPAASASLPPNSEDMKDKLYPADVQTVIEDGKRQIIKTYILTAGEKPDHIPRDSFTLDGWLYELTDITQDKTGNSDVKSHIETLEISTDRGDMNDILTLLSPTLEYESKDGYCGLLTLDLASVKCEAAGYENSSYTVTVTREYQHLASNDLYFIPKTVTENGRTLALDSVEWKAQNPGNVDYAGIPDSYRAVAIYTGKATQKVVTEYITTADYTGEVTRIVKGDTVYKSYFTGQRDAAPNAAPVAEQEIEPTSPTTPMPDKDSRSAPVVPLIAVAVIVMACAGAAVFFFLRHNANVYSISEGGDYALVAKVRISAKNPTIDLTPLAGRPESQHFRLEIDKLAAKALNGKTVDVISGSVSLQHKIAYEGNAYKIEVNFHDETIKAIY